MRVGEGPAGRPAQHHDAVGPVRRRSRRGRAENHGENTEEDREKMKQELTEVHELFKQRIRELRPDIDLDEVATGEHWYGSKALDLKLIDEIGTSDDFLLAAVESADLYKISYTRHKRFMERVLQGAEGALYR